MKDECTSLLQTWPLRGSDAFIVVGKDSCRCRHPLDPFSLLYLSVA